MSSISQKIVQTHENTRFVFASTDTTAIYSFVIAAIVGIILALIGVFLAWWYGKKSFDLTTKSFDITVKQILASIDSAKENTDKSSQMNRDLILSQQKIHHKELNFRYMHEWIRNLDDLSSEYFGEVLSYVRLINRYASHQELELSNIEQQWENFKETLDLLGEKLEKVSKLKLKLLLLIGKKTEKELSIIDDLEFMDKWIRGEFLTKCFAERIDIKLDDEDYLKFLSRVNKCKDKIIELRYYEISTQLNNY